MGNARSLGWKCKDKIRQHSLYQSHSWEIQSITAAKIAGIKNNTQHTTEEKCTLSLSLPPEMWFQTTSCLYLGFV